MKRASNQFDPAELEQVNQAVAAAESKTSAEIVPAVATCAGRYDRAEDIVGLFFGLTSLIAAWLLFQRIDTKSASWEGSTLTLQLPTLVGVMLVGFLIGTAAGAKISWLRRLFTPRVQMKNEVLDAAHRVFFDQRVHHTDGSSGVLLYISLFERQAVVLADRHTLEAIGQDKIDATCASLTADLRNGSITAALCASIAAVGEMLAEPMPRAADDVNELSDALVLID